MILLVGALRHSFFIIQRTWRKFNNAENVQYIVLKSLVIKATERNIGNQSQNTAERTESWIQPPVNCTPTHVQLQTIGWFKTMNAQEKSHHSSFSLCNANSFQQSECLKNRSSVEILFLLVDNIKCTMISLWLHFDSENKLCPEKHVYYQNSSDVWIAVLTVSTYQDETCWEMRNGTL